MNYLNKLINVLTKNPVTINEFNKLLEKSDTFFDSVELEKELLLLNGLPLYFSDNMVYLKTATTQIKDQTFCVVDIETTAGNAKDGQIIEIGAVKIKNGQIIEKYESLVNANDIPKIIQELTGITPQMVHKAPNLKDVLEEFKIFLEDDIFVAHAIAFDYKFISDSFKKYDLGELCNRRICTIDLSKRVIETERYGLKYLKKHLNIDIDNHHRAYSDALSTAEILKYCLTKVPNNIKTSEDLIKFSIGK
ncbi:MAG: 3'-5' exonuclease [Campylobacterota bacterium]|nr:3'-5' exonuclease [Campylobacterota bacterium]